MNLFGRVDNDLTLLHLSPAILKEGLDSSKICISAFDEQVNHHCIRIAWREHFRKGTPVRDLLNMVAATTYIRLTEAVPYEDPDCSDDFNDELSIRLRVKEAQYENEIRSCLGFLIDDQMKALFDSGLSHSATFPPPYSVFEDSSIRYRCYATHNPKTRLETLHAMLLDLLARWEEYRSRVATSPLHRETVRIVAAATGKDPMLNDHYGSIVSRIHIVGEGVAKERASH